ncbi:MAG: hypothetical protein HHJ12_14215 [Glaciimonas sp.]|nr:hypothetical protein [Glaciimonas sp.]
MITFRCVQLHRVPASVFRDCASLSGVQVPAEREPSALLRRGLLCRIASLSAAARRRIFLLVALPVLLLAAVPAQAIDYTFPGALPLGCVDNGGGSYACGALTLAANDTFTIASPKPATITFSGAFTTGAGVAINSGGATSDLSLVVNGAFTLAATSTLKANVQTRGLGAVTIGAGSTVSGNVSTETGFVSLGAPATVGGSISTITGYVVLGASAIVGGSVSTLNAGYVVLGASARVGGAIAVSGAGYVTTGDSAIVGGSISTVSDAITVGASSQVGGSIAVSQIGGVTLGASAGVGGDISTETGSTTVGAGGTVGGQISMNVTGAISIAAGGKVHAVCCYKTNASCVTNGSGILPGPLVCTAPGGSAANFECLETGVSINNLVSNSSLRNPLYTKLVSTDFKFDIAALKTDGTLESNYVAVGGNSKYTKVELFDDTTAPASCPAYANPVASTTATFTSGTYSGAAGRTLTPNINIGNVYKKLRCRVKECTDSTCASFTTVAPACSSDQFSVRPAAFLAAQNTTTFNAGSTFTLQATAVKGDLTTITTNYTGVPTLNLSQMTGTPGFTVAALAPSVLPAAQAGVSNATFTYDDVGSFTLPATSPGTYGISDSTFTSVDGSSDCIAGSASNTPVTSGNDKGKIGCLIGQSAALTVGRFYPDHFDITPSFTAGCSGAGFTYMDQPFTLGYTVTAKSLGRVAPTPPGNLPLQLYSGGKLNLAAINGSTDWVARLSLAASNPPAPAVSNPLSPTWSNGSYILTPTSYKFTRPTTTPADLTWGAFDALNIGVAIDDGDGIGYPSATSTFTATTPASCTKSGATECKKYASLTGGATTKMLYGRIALSNAHGSERLALPIPMKVQYYKAGSGWLTNTDDSCTPIALPASIGFTYAALSAKNKLSLAGNSVKAYLGNASGIVTGNQLSLASPGSSAVGPGIGYVDVFFDLAAMPWLNFNWKGKPTPTTAELNPAARATFGVYTSGNRSGNGFIYIREMY